MAKNTRIKLADAAVIPGAEKPQIAKEQFLSMLSAMKKNLKLGELKYSIEAGDSNEIKQHKLNAYKEYKSLIMDIHWGQLEEILDRLETLGFIQECGCNYNIAQRNGYKATCGWCNGCGFKNTGKTNQLLFETIG